MIYKKSTTLEGCYELLPIVREDIRGKFIKTYHEADFVNLNLDLEVKEEYYSTSYCGVLRGLHFQIPPAEHEKLVYCSYGKVLDVIVDLRKGSSYGKYMMLELSADKGNMLYIPKGMAHGFYTISDIAVMMYKVSSVYSPEHDSGIAWNSVRIPWPNNNPIISERDKSFQKLSEFTSPF